MFGSLLAASALISVLGAGDSTIAVFKPVDTGHSRSTRNAPTSKAMNLVIPSSALRNIGKLSLSQIQQLAGSAGLKQTVKSLSSTLHFDARNLVVGTAYMTIGRSNVDPSQNTILFDPTAGGGIKISFDAKSGEGQYFIDATVSVVGSPALSSTIDQAFEQRTINAQTRHLCWFVNTNGGKHTFELWTSTPSFVILKGIDIIELK